MQNIGLLTAQATLRALLIAVAAVAAARPVRDELLAPRGQTARRLAWALALGPWLAPSLFAGYVYLPAALALVRQPGWKEVLYDLVLLLRLTPAAVLALHLSPPPLTAQALHCRRLLTPARGWSWDEIRFLLRGAGRGPWTAGALVFLLAFGEFDLATMWNVRTWTAALFDAQVGGLALGESLRLARWPLGVSAAALMLAVALARGGGLGISPEHRPAAPSSQSDWRPWGVWWYLALSAGLLAAWPLARLLPEAFTGAGALVGNVGLGRDIVFTTLLATGAAAAAWIVAGEGLRYPWLGMAGAGAGLVGGLLLALLLLGFFQLPGAQIFYNTPVPLLAALALALLPGALLLRWLRRWTRAGPALHLAGLLGAGRLRWDLDGRKTYWAGVLLFGWAYFDLTISALLAPPGLMTVAVRVFNLMHYGRSPALSAMLCAAVAAPTAGVFLVSAVWRALQKKK